MTLRLEVPTEPEDGHRLVWWRTTSSSLIQHRMTFVKNKPCMEVNGRHGNPYKDTWASECRFVLAGEGAWVGNGRTEHHRMLDREPMADAFLSFEDAKADLIRKLHIDIEDWETRIEETRAKVGLVERMTEPA